MKNVPESKILKIQEDPVPENTKKSMKFQRIEKTFEQFQDMSLAITDFINPGKPGIGRNGYHMYRVHL